jgi:hypothetical protein
MTPAPQRQLNPEVVMPSNQKQHFLSEAARYGMLAHEALFAVVTAMPHEY